MNNPDQTQRTFSAVELRTAHRLVSEGANVRALPERTGIRTADAEVNGVETEFKHIRSARAVTVKHALNRAKGQAKAVVLDAVGSGLSIEPALTGVRRYVASGSRQFDSITLELDNWTLTIYGNDTSSPQVRARERGRQ